MKFDVECARDIMLAIEASAFGERLTLSMLHDKLPQHPVENLCYACLKLYEGGLIHLMTVEACGSTMPQIIDIGDLTFRGHELLAKTRDSEQWSTVKKCAGAVRNYSLSAIEAIAEGATSAGISAFFQI